MNSALFASMNGWSDSWYREHKLPLLWSVGERVLEIGAGTGANFSYYPPRTEVLVIEPNQHMHVHLRQRAKEFDLKLRIINGVGEKLPLDDQSQQSVVGTLLLCSVQSASKVMDEVARVLKPGGVYHFVEHVAGNSGVRTFQNIMKMPWRLTFSGCNLLANTEELLEQDKRFETLMATLDLGPRWLPIRPHIVGRAIRVAA